MGLPESFGILVKTERATYICLGCLLLLFATIMLSNLDGWDLWNPDEPRYAQVAREMLETGQYLMPHLNGEIYPDKPPLFFWLMALASKPRGDVTAFTARFPSVIASLGVMLLTFLTAQLFFDRLTGLVAVVILFASEQFTHLATRANIDMTLSLLTTAALFLFASGYLRPHRKRPFYLLAYGAMGLAVLTKGPVGFFVPLVIIVLFLASRRELAALKSIDLGKGVLLVLGIVAAWFVPACLAGGSDYLQETIGRQIMGRVVDSYSHRAPLYYYFLNFPFDFLPWSLFIPSACIYFWLNRGRGLSIGFPLVWFAGTFIFFTCISGKRGLYLMPLYPAAALLMATLWRDHIGIEDTGSACGRLKLFSIPGYLLCGLLLVAGVAVSSALLLRIDVAQPLFSIQKSFYPLLGLLMIGGGMGVVLVRSKQRAATLFVYIALIMTLAHALVAAMAFPAFNTFKSAQPFCQRIQKIVKPNDRLIAYFEPELFNYFLHRYPIPYVKDPEAVLGEISSPDRIYLLLEAKHLQRAPEEYRKILTVLDQQTIGHATYCLATNKPV